MSMPNFITRRCPLLVLVWVAAVFFLSPAWAVAQQMPIIEAWLFQPLGLDDTERTAKTLDERTSHRNEKNNSSFMPPSHAQYEFDDAGQLTVMRRLDAGGVVVKTWSIDRGERGRIDKIHEATKDGPQFFEEATYSRLGKLEKITRYRAMGNHGEMRQVRVEDRRRSNGTGLVAVWEFDDMGGQGPRFVWETDFQGRASTFRILNVENKPLTEVRYQYGRERFPKSSTTLAADVPGGSIGVKVLREMTYEVDERGNWTQRRIEKKMAFSDGKTDIGSVETTDRVLTYHPPTARQEKAEAIRKRREEAAKPRSAVGAQPATQPAAE